jgi:uncharacterized small protein (DUF1192 family)
MIDDKDQRIADLENKLQKLEVEGYLAVNQLVSKREMNAILTDEVERLRAELDTTRLDERRALIVACLRELNDWQEDCIADEIEAGEHLK